MLLGYENAEKPNSEHNLSGKKFLSSAFYFNANIHLNACGTGAKQVPNPDGGYYSGDQDWLFQILKEKVGGKIKGYYSTIWWGSDWAGKKGLGLYHPTEKEYTFQRDRDLLNETRRRKPLKDLGSARTRTDNGNRKIKPNENRMVNGKVY